MRTRRTVIVLAVSLAAHLALMAAWMSARPDTHWVEPPTMVVQLVRPPPKPLEPTPRPRSAPARVLSRPARASEPTPVEQTPAPPPEDALQIAPEWRVKPQPPLVLKPLRRAFRQPPCRTTQDPSNRAGEPCPAGGAEEAIARYDSEKDSDSAAFAAGGRERRAKKRYKELEGTAGFPGLRCSLFSRC